MSTEYLNPTGPEMAQRSSYGRCAWCGAVDDPKGCFCRFCESCSQFWKEIYRKDYDEGRPAYELCRSCEMDMEDASV